MSRCKATIADMAKFYAQLQWYAEDRCFDEGWAAHQYRKRFGEWPNHPVIKQATPIQPNLRMRNWIKAQMITFARKREGRAHG